MSLNTDFSAQLLRWYDENRRVLPWREDPTPYHVWLSEIMLQQTRVEAVLPYYNRFLAALPDIPALANAPEDLYLKLWEGLGYYSRVRNLHKGAEQIMTEHHGEMPGTAAELQKIAGIGPYTAAAIASIAFQEPVPAVDGNLLRIFARLTAYAESIREPAARQRALAFFTDRIPSRRPGDFNQALMDLGSGICRAHGEPLCTLCPLRGFCAAGQNGTAALFPKVPEKKPRPVTHYTVFLIHDQEKIALRKRPRKGLLAGLYEFPNTEGALSEDEAVRFVRSLGFSPLRLRPLPSAKHLFTHREWQLSGYEVLTDELRLEAAEDNVGEQSESDIAQQTAASLSLSDNKSGAEYPQNRLARDPMQIKIPAGESPSGIMLVSLAAIQEEYSIPSAFSVYKEYLLNQA